MRGLCQDIAELRRGDHSAARLQIERERWREATDEQIMEYFERWVQTPKVREWICCGHLPPEERALRLREIFGQAPAKPDGDPANPSESN